jgi:hypothetical protein
VLDDCTPAVCASRAAAGHPKTSDETWARPGGLGRCLPHCRAASPTCTRAMSTGSRSSATTTTAAAAASAATVASRRSAAPSLTSPDLAARGPAGAASVRARFLGSGLGLDSLSRMSSAAGVVSCRQGVGRARLCWGQGAGGRPGERRAQAGGQACRRGRTRQQGQRGSGSTRGQHAAHTPLPQGGGVPWPGVRTRSLSYGRCRAAATWSLTCRSDCRSDLSAEGGSGVITASARPVACCWDGGDPRGCRVRLGRAPAAASAASRCVAGSAGWRDAAREPRREPARWPSLLYVLPSRSDTMASAGR